MQRCPPNRPTDLTGPRILISIDSTGGTSHRAHHVSPAESVLILIFIFPDAYDLDLYTGTLVAELQLNSQDMIVLVTYPSDNVARCG